MYFNLDWRNDKTPAICAENLNHMQKQYDEAVEQVEKKKKDPTVPLVIRRDIDPNEANPGEMFFLSGVDSLTKINQTQGKTFLTFIASADGRLRYNFLGTEFRYKMVDKETASYYMQAGTEQEEDPAGHGTGTGTTPTEEREDNRNKTYRVYFMTVGGSSIPTQEVAGGTQINTPSQNPYKDGYTFTGWYLDAEYTKLVPFPLTIVQDTYLYAKWEELGEFNWVVHCETDGGTIIPDEMVPNGSQITRPETVKEGYRIAGWYLDKDFVKQAFFPYYVYQNTDLYVKWEDARTYMTITLIKGQNDADIVDVEYGTEYELPEPEKDGYFFGGWFTEESCINEVKSPIKATSNMVLYAKWEEWADHFRTVTLVDGDIVETRRVERGNPIAIGDKKKEGYIFLGWYHDAEFTQPLENAIFTVTENITLYAKWGQNVRHTITLINQGQTYQTMTTEEGLTYTPPQDLTLSGYTFGGWYYDEGFTQLAPEHITVSSDITLYAYWIAETPRKLSELNTKYIRDWTDTGWRKVKAYSGGINVIENILPTGSYTKLDDVDYESVTCGLQGTYDPADEGAVVNSSRTNQFILIELNTPTQLDSIFVSHSTYDAIENEEDFKPTNHLLEISEDGDVWYPVHSWLLDGEETEPYKVNGTVVNGITYNLTQLETRRNLASTSTLAGFPIRYIRDTAFQNNSYILYNMQIVDWKGTQLIAPYRKNSRYKITDNLNTEINWMHLPVGFSYADSSPSYFFTNVSGANNTDVTSLIFDLGGWYEIDHIKSKHFPGGRWGDITINSNYTFKTEVSSDGVHWFTVYDNGTDEAITEIAGQGYKYDLKEIDAPSQVYKIVVKSNISKEDRILEVTSNQTLKLPELFEYGYEFKGYYRDDNYTLKVEEVSNITENIVLYAEFNEITDGLNTLNIKYIRYYGGDIGTYLIINGEYTWDFTLTPYYTNDTDYTYGIRGLQSYTQRATLIELANSTNIQTLRIYTKGINSTFVKIDNKTWEVLEVSEDGTTWYPVYSWILDADKVNGSNQTFNLAKIPKRVNPQGDGTLRSLPVRYIRDTATGGDVYRQINVYDWQGVELLQNYHRDNFPNPTILIDGNDRTEYFKNIITYIGGKYNTAEQDAGDTMVIDLGAEHNLDHIRIRHWGQDGATYDDTSVNSSDMGTCNSWYLDGYFKNHKIEVSRDGVYWFTLYDLATDGNVKEFTLTPSAVDTSLEDLPYVAGHPYYLGDKEL